MEGWATKEFDDAQLSPVKSRGRVPAFNSKISLPNFEQGEASHVSDFFGYIGFISVAAAVVAGSFFAGIAKKLLPLGIRLLHISSHILYVPIFVKDYFKEGLLK